MLNISPKNQSTLAKRRNRLLRKQTPQELRIAKLLTEIGVKFLPQKGFFNENTHYIVDFYLPKNKKLCLEIDGCHHFNGQQLHYDNRRTEFLTKTRRFRVKRLSNAIADSITKEDLLAFVT